MAVKSRFTRIPKVHDLILAGVPTEVIPTYCALADYSNNKTGLCWPRMETLARRLSRSPRTIQRHLHLLKEKGLVEFVERKRDWHGRFGAYVYRVLHIAAATVKKKDAKEVATRKEWRRKKRSTTGHGDLMASNKRRTKRQEEAPLPPKGDIKQGYEWLFGQQTTDHVEEAHRLEMEKRRSEEAKRRREGYGWVFK